MHSLKAAENKKIRTFQVVLDILYPECPNHDIKVRMDDVCKYPLHTIKRRENGLFSYFISPTFGHCVSVIPVEGQIISLSAIRLLIFLSFF